MSILRSSARCPALLARVVLAQPTLARTLSVAALLQREDKALPSRDWGAPRNTAGGPTRGDHAGSSNAGGSNRRGGQGGQRRSNQDGAAGGGQNRAPRTRDGARRNQHRDGAQGDRSGQAWQGGQSSQGGQAGNRRPWVERGDAAQRQPRQPRAGPSRDSPPATSSTPASGAERQPRAPAFDRGTETGGTAPAPRGRDDEGDDRHGRPRARRESRSLLHAADGDYLPPARHHSAKKGKPTREHRDRNQRQWVIDEEGQDDAIEAMLRAEREKVKKRKAAKHVQAKQSVEKDVYIPSSISVAQLSEKFGVKLFHLQRKMTALGMTDDQRRPDYLLNADDASNLALEFNLNPVIDAERGFDIYPEAEEDVSQAPLRPPVVTIMGHVDHGKTTLLDALRHTSVAAGEAGGITQHIGAFSVPLSSLQPEAASSDATITFLDTPGHAAFTGMRARGASVTDLVVLVVAADDGVMPQTREVLNLVKAEGDNVGLVVAINKCDKPMIDIERVKSDLGAEGIILEEDGGDIPSVRVSGLARTGLDELVETLSTLAEVRDLRARQDGKAEGYVLESRVDKGRGTVTTVLVTRGTLKTGSSVVAGKTWARVRQMTDSNGKPLTSAGPGTPISITGWKDVPSAGDQLLEASNEDAAKRCITNRLRDAERLAMAADAEQINQKRQEDRVRAAAEAEQLEAAKESGQNVTQVLHALRRDTPSAVEMKELRLVIKADVSGTVEAIVGALQDIGNKEAGVKIVGAGVGDVSESDVQLAEASGATIVGFNVACPRSVAAGAASVQVPVLTDGVIYRLIDAVRTRVAALLPPKIEYRITGEAVVQQLFPIKIGRKETKVIAGCKINNGVVNKAEGVRVLRGANRDIVFEGTMDTLKHLKKDVSEMRKGTECGIGLAGFDDMKEGDEIVTFTTHEVARTL